MVFYDLIIHDPTKFWRSVDTIDRLVKELEKVVTCENIIKIEVKVWESHSSYESYFFHNDGSILCSKKEKNGLVRAISTPTIKQKLEAELQNKLPQSIQQIKIDGKTPTIPGTEVEMQQNLAETQKNIEDLLNQLRQTTKINEIPTIKPKVEAESLNNSPQNVQPIKTNEKVQTPNFLLIKDNEAQEKSFVDMQTEVSKMSLEEIQKIIIYDIVAKINYKYSSEKLLFVSKDDKTLSDELTKHLTCTYKMLIVSAEDLNNPFKLTRRYICETKVSINGDCEYNEMHRYFTGPIGFKYDELFKEHLVRIYVLKNNVIICEINNSGMSHKNLPEDPGVIHMFKNMFEKCLYAMNLYLVHVHEFRRKPFGEIKEIYCQMMGNFRREVISSGAIGYGTIGYGGFKVPNDADEMVNIMIKVNEFGIHF